MDNATQKKQAGYRVTDLPQMTDLNNNDLFLITHVKDEYGSYESQSVPFKRLTKAVKKRGFKEELETLAEINETYVDGDELAEELKKYSPVSHDHDSAYSKLGHGHDAKEISGLDIPTKASQLENDVPFLSAHQSLDGYATEDWVGKNFADAIHRHVASDVADFAESVQELTPKKVSDLKQDIPYLTEHQSLDGYATEKWVGGQGYVNEQWVRGQGFTTEKWVTSQGYIDAKALEPYQKKTVFRDWTEGA